MFIPFYRPSTLVIGRGELTRLSQVYCGRTNLVKPNLFEIIKKDVYILSIFLFKGAREMKKM
jgi:hypothetical protein